MVKYKLIYFDLMGRGEIPRLMFKTAGIEFEDYRISLAQWPEFKKSFYGRSYWESSRIDSICETVGDYEHDIDRLFDQEETQEVKAFVKKRYEEEKIPKIFGILETLLKENNDGDGFFVGEKISMADFVVFVFIDVGIRTMFTFKEPTGFPKLTAHLKRMKEVPQIKEWMEIRPKTPY
ncbi:Glutathione S-transferase [Holothuria leucospilota]|uniref:Glutathione S-transferase n=1 Tax=Holothuria leucospilota TaxID=206669 RepID=A0A9Q1H3X3_HOLLE|nr:Glutathione S-transferase [Holothuria leucospilota]